MLATKVLSLLVLCSALLTANAWAQEGPYLDYDEYDQQLDDANALIEAERYAEALIAFQELSTVRLFEAPNYEPFFFIAKSQYFLGQLTDANENLRQFKCMLRVDSGAMKCANAVDYEKSTPDNRVYYDTDFSGLDLCFHRMCDELYHSYYEDPSEATLQRIAKYWVDVDMLQSQINNEIAKRELP